MGNMAQTFFYLKVDIKSKLFTDANLSMTKKKFFTPIYYSKTPGTWLWDDIGSAYDQILTLNK